MFEDDVEVGIEEFMWWWCGWFYFVGNGDKISNSMSVEIVLIDNIDDFAAIAHDNYINQ